MTATLVVLLLGLVATAAVAQTPRRVVTGFSLSTDGELTGARLRITNTFPGDTRSVGVFLEGGYTPAVDLIDLTLSDLVDLENTCLRPEERAGDDCSSPEGELSKFVTVSSVAGWERIDGGELSCEVAPDSPPTGPTRLIDLLAVGELQIERPPTERGDVMCGVLTLHFVLAEDANLAQTDSATFVISTRFQWDPERVPEEFWTGGAPGTGAPGTGVPPVATDPDPDTDPGEDPDPARPTPSPSPPPLSPTPAPDEVEPGQPAPSPDGPGLPEVVVEPEDDDQVGGTVGSRGPGGRLPYTGATVLGMLVFGAVTTTLGAFLLRTRRAAVTAEVRP